MGSKLSNLQKNVTELSEAIEILNLFGKQIVTFHLYSHLSDVSEFFQLECPHGWIDGGRKIGCYHFAKDASKMVYASAQDYCKSLDGRAHLAEIRTQEIQEFLDGLEDLQSYRNWWLGGNDEEKV